MNPAEGRLQQLAVPAGALGRLADVVRTLAAVQGVERPACRPAQLLVFAADHPVAARGVSAYPAAVTPAMVYALATGRAAAAVMARHLGVPVSVIDVGVDAPYPDPPTPDGIRWRRAAHEDPAGDLSVEPALSSVLLAHCVAVGAGAVAALPVETRVLVLGEVGIGNTTAAAALVAALTGRAARDVVGRGTGVDDAGWARKVAVVQAALDRLGPDPDATRALAEVGGRELAALVGAIEAAAAGGLLVIADGLLIGAALLVAIRRSPSVRGCVIFGHRADETGHRAALDALAGVPLLDLGLRIGEGTGALAALPLVDLACALQREMATFADAAVPDRA